MTERTRRDFLFVGCEAGHNMRHIGGCNAGCHEDCGCSVPVYACSLCGDCDYGDNNDADKTRADCALLFGDPATRFASEPTVRTDRRRR